MHTTFVAAAAALLIAGRACRCHAAFCRVRRPKSRLPGKDLARCSKIL